jgi:alkylhydroperoxidase/carboxymuconolactone decarboxylase family protein YurZ
MIMAHPNFDFQVNEENIHMELSILPSQIFEAGEMVADTRRAMDEYKRQLELMESQMDGQIRANPALYNISKITEGAITAAIEMIPDIQELKQKIIEGKHANDVSYAAANALDAKRKSLESLVQLRNIGYFAAKSS